MSFLPLMLIIATVAACAATGGIFKPGPWYQSLAKPSWVPPNWMFPVVWMLLYVLIAWAGWRIWQASQWSTPMVFWVAQAIFNGLWSYYFFGKKRMDWAMLDVALLWAAIAGFIATAWPIDPISAVMFLPYLLWVTVAAALNATMMRLNRDEVVRRSKVTG